MKKVLLSLVALVAIFALASCATASNAPFEVGSDYTEYTMAGATAWASTETINLYVHADDDVLFNGQVCLTSDDQFVGEVLHAAGIENGFSTDGDLSGFVMTMGPYVGGTNDCYWSFYVNGHSSNWGCDQVHLFDGDYVEWSFEPMVW